MKKIAAVLLAFAFTGCFSHTQSKFQAARGACNFPAEMAGRWTSSRPSQFGPANMTLTLRCDCRYTMRAAAAIVRVTEDGEFRLEGDHLVMSRSNGSETSWPYRFENGALHLTEAADETHEYRLVEKIACAR